ncbi:J domain-containing protein [Starkeya koreensis]|uniref:J domain-containing protein n=1 Tax=Ancylobacter koreensis TaxID=266121 RepID=A0ABT0DGK8_9HYPH|nr:DnaJ domain-containing protein [Ancylobacter koreensis]MCK0206425.1 J domain-containing protein [Ancylobacter koreensis]
MAEFDALEAALALLKDPVVAHRLPQVPLPDGVAVVLAAAIGDEQVLGLVSRRYGKSQEVIREAASFYVEQALLAPGGDSYRVLGASRKATHEELRRNMALLMRWLHPDLQALRGTAASVNREVFSARVTAAWGDLKSDEKRASYDLAHPPSADPPRPGRAGFRWTKRGVRRTASDSGRPPAHPTGAASKPRVAAESADARIKDAVPLIRRGRRPSALSLRKIEGGSFWLRLLLLFRGAR